MRFFSSFFETNETDENDDFKCDMCENLNDDLNWLKIQNDAQDLKIKDLTNKLNCYRNLDDGQLDYINKIEDIRLTKQYEYLVLSGGGIKGVCYCGALQVLDEYGILYDENKNMKIKGIVGTSAGSIVAAFLAIGYTPSEIENIMNDIDFEKIVDDKIGVIRDTYNFVENKGVCPGEYIYDLLGDIISKKVNDPDYTIEQLYKDKNFKLVIVATDILHNKSIYFNPLHQTEYNRNIPIRKAVRMSMSIPFLFEPVNYNNQLCVDGGVLDNYAIHVFDGEEIGDPDGVLNILRPNPKVLGLKIITKDRVDGNKESNIKSIIQYSVNFIDLFLCENERRAMTPFNSLRTIEIITDNFPLTSFELSKTQKESLLSCGKTCTKNYFNL